MALYCSKTITCIIKRNNVKTPRQFLLFKLSLSFRKQTENKLESYKKVCQNKDFCNVVMPSEDTKILESNQSQKSDKAPFVIYQILNV